MIEGRQAQGSYPWTSLVPEGPRSGAAPVRGCHLDPGPGALEGTTSGKNCSSSAAVEEAFVPGWQARVEACVEGSPSWRSPVTVCPHSVAAVEREMWAGLGNEKSAKGVEIEGAGGALGRLSCRWWTGTACKRYDNGEVRST